MMRDWRFIGGATRRLNDRSVGAHALRRSAHQSRFDGAKENGSLREPFESTSNVPGGDKQTNSAGKTQ
jgi:predicted TIM-barrel fold metal-dependent hydrolase